MLRNIYLISFSAFLIASFEIDGDKQIDRERPHIILIVADDLGYNDVSWHNPDILTPNLGRLAAAGVILEQSYVQPICTPTRSALMTGRYPIHTGDTVTHIHTLLKLFQ